MAFEMKKLAKYSFASALLASLMLGGCASKTVEPGSEGAETSKGAGSGDGMKEGGVVAADEKIREEKVISGGSESGAMGEGGAAARAELASIYFDFDKFNIRPDQVASVESVGSKLTSEELMNNKVRIEGNCDEWGTDEYNYALGLKRAKSVRDSLERLEVSADRMTLISYGESNPVCNEHNKACWEKNRRAEFKLLP